MPGASVELSICQMNDNKVHIIVNDTGIGIASEQQTIIFGRFKRVLDGHSEQITGAGIGLALVQELVISHEGTISLKSKLKHGSTFTIALPQYFPSDDEKVQSSSLTQANSEVVELEVESLVEQSDHKIHEKEHYFVKQGEYAEETKNEKTTILVVEDNPDMRAYISAELTNDYHILIAANGKQGLEVATENIPDLIISDVMMPEMDGFTLCRALKSQELTSHIPFILLTARSDRSSRLQGWQDQADEYLTKPFDSEELLLRIENLLSIRDLLKSRFYQKTQGQIQANILPALSATNILKENKELIQIDNSKLESSGSPWEKHEEEFIAKLKQKIELDIANPEMKVDEIARSLAMSKRQLYRKLKGVLNVTPAIFVRDFRLEKAQQLISKGEVISNVAFDIGFTSHSYFSSCYRAKYGESPSVYAERIKL